MKEQCRLKALLINTLLLIASVGSATAFGWIFDCLEVPETNTVVVYIFFVVLSTCCAPQYSYAYGAVASLVSTFSFNFFFTEPFLSISVDNPTYLITFIVMTVISIIIGMLTTKARNHAEEAKEKEVEAEQERYRSNLLRAISHDLRTPLAGIMGSSEMLMHKIPIEDSCYKIAEGIYQDADWLCGVVQNTLSLTQIRDGKIRLNKRPELAEELVESAVRVMAKRAPEHEIIVELPQEPLWIQADARLIEQVLVNLLDNAVRHTKVGEEIRLTVSDHNRNAVFTVLDAGEGIAKEDLDNIFEMFYTSCRGGADSRRGVGLGLTICQSIVEAHGGRISGENRKEAKGAVFTFILPQKEDGYAQ